MAAKETIFITGITGSLGSELARLAIRRGAHLVALVRAEDDATAQQKLCAALDPMPLDTIASNISLLRGNISEEGLGLSDISGLNITRVIHCAASIELGDKRREVNYATNVDGTRNVLNLCSRLNVPLVYVSTAYVAGKRQGLVKEDELDQGQKFNSVYEKTKVEAELLVRQWAQQHSLPAAILRPSIVIGHSGDGRIRNFSTIYDFFRVVDIAAARFKDKELRIAGQAEATENFIPVDYFAETAWHIALNHPSGVFHITNPNPVTIEELRCIFVKLFGLIKLKLVDPEDFLQQPPTRLEQLCRNAGRVYANYMKKEPQFDRTNIDQALLGTGITFPKMDLPYFQRICDYAKQQNWKRAEQYQSKQPQQLPANIEHYFLNFLASKMHQRLLPDLKHFTACFQIRLKEYPQAKWSLSVVDGVLESVSSNGLGASCVFVVDADTFHDVVSGKKPPQQAFFEQKIEIDGDIEVGLRAASVLANFFQAFPYEASRA